jgi:hypothetical protein
MAKQTRRRAAVRKSKAKTGRQWSAEVTETSDAMTLEKDVFKSRSPKRIAQSVKRSAERSHRRKSGPFRSAMSMLTFYINAAARICRHRASACWKRRRTGCAGSSIARRRVSSRDRSARYGAFWNARFARFAPIR